MNHNLELDQLFQSNWTTKKKCKEVVSNQAANFVNFPYPYPISWEKHRTYTILKIKNPLKTLRDGGNLL